MSAFVVAAEANLDPAKVEFFEQRIRPLLTTHCLKCHSGEEPDASLRLDVREGWAKGGDSGPAILAGKPDQSLLIRMVRKLPVKMPPKGKLSDEEVADLVKWVEQGAVDPRTGGAGGVAKPTGIDWAKGAKHWAYQPVMPVTPPAVSDASLAQPIDRFIAAGWSAARVKPAAMAEKRQLIRRASFTLTGLPPTLEEVRAFEADQSPDAFAKVIDRLIGSPRYGEHQARQWFDVVRFAEDRFSQDDQKEVNPWRYRDWVISAFNDDMPYDRFLKLQLAADLMEKPGDDPRHRAALGFIALGPNFGFVNDNDRSSAEEWNDRIDVMSRGFLGLTVACARCHDHKYDPIPMEDFYSLAGVFASSRSVIVPVAAQAEIERYNAAKKVLTDAEDVLKAHVKAEADRRAVEFAKTLPMLTEQIWEWMAKALEQPALKAEDFAKASGIDAAQFVGVHKYLMATNRGEGHYLHKWFAMLPKKDSLPIPPAELKPLAELFRDKVLDNIAKPAAQRNLDQMHEHLAIVEESRRPGDGELVPGGGSCGY
ncbi:MAG: DUF1549 domain-containing protein [Alphaproteobacteria bacterium]|nr:DUF1549 domain-containing protein [Alphaproteobacteria bacterium]